jgi:hypothetical protein
MICRGLIRAMGAAAVLVTLANAAAAVEAAKYPDWKGAWTRWFPPGSVLEPNGGFTAGGQPSHDQTKPSGRGQEARSLLNIKRFSRKASRTKPTAERAIFLTTRFAACPEACRS